MKNLMKLLLMLAMTFAIASCAKEDEGGSSKAVPAPPVVDPTPTVTDDFYSSSSAEFGSFDKLKDYYMNKSFDTGSVDGQIVYHIGPEYGMQTSGGSFNFDFCINFFGSTIGDCDDVGNTTILQGIVDNGKYKVVTSANASGVSYNEADSVENDQFVFEPRNLDQTSESFSEMLNLDNQPVIKVLVSKADITLSDGSKVNGDLVEYFYSQGGPENEAFIISKDLPMLANPVAIFNATGSAQGALNNVGNKLIKSVSAMKHSVQYNFITGETTVVEAGPIGLTLNN